MPAAVPSSFLAPQFRVWFLAALVVLTLGWGVTAWNVARPMIAGDGGEYLTQLESWRRHGSPDLRPADVTAVTALAHQNRYRNPSPEFGFFTSPRDGRKYSWHFWAYSLAALPVRLLLEAGHGNPILSFALLNSLLFFATFIAAAGVARATNSPRPLVLWTLCAGCPLLWYLRWPTPEVWTWAAFFGALLCLDARRYTLGTLLAALAALQNPPLLFVAWWFVALALMRPDRSLRHVLPVAGAACLCFLPNVFYLLFFGKSNLIFAKAYALDLSLISPARFASFLFDLNQGMLPYVPIVMGLAVWSVLRAFRKPLDGLALAGFAILMVMIATCCLNADWNVGEAGMRRYATWMMPLWVWVMLRGLDLARARLAIYAALLWQIAMFVSHDGSNYFLGYTPWARWVMVHVPAAYNPVPLIFVERSPLRGKLARQVVPVAVLDREGNATKILLTHDSLGRLKRDYAVDSRWLNAQKLPGKTALQYFNPPRGAVKARPAVKKMYDDWQKRYENW